MRDLTMVVSAENKYESKHQILPEMPIHKIHLGLSAQGYQGPWQRCLVHCLRPYVQPLRMRLEGEERNEPPSARFPPADRPKTPSGVVA